MQRVSLERNSVSRVDPASICLGQMIAQAAKKARSSISTCVGSKHFDLCRIAGFEDGFLRRHNALRVAGGSAT